MPPKSSSASSGTRKKHLRKALGEVEPPPPREKKEKGKKAHRSDPPRPKVYIAPVKPAAAVPDPLESSGLAHRLPPALLVVLRSLGKKAPVTKVRALEELQRDWVAPCARAGAEEEDGEGGKSTVYAVLDMLPVWLHHLPAHLVHPSRRIRLLTATLHQTLLRNALLREQLVNGAELPAASGTWALAAQDPDRAVAAAAGAARVTPDVEILVPFLERTLMDPDGLYAELNPPPLAVPPPPPRGSAAGRGRGSSANARGSVRPTGVVEPLAPIPRAKGDEQEESEGDRRARLRIAAFGALKHLLASTSTSNANAAANEDDDEQAEDKDGRDEQEDDPYATYAANPAYRDTEGFGHGQPALRRAAWALVPTTLPPALLLTLARAVLRSAWVEPDSGVQGAMWAGVLGVVKAHPPAWSLAPQSYHEFLHSWLARAAGGTPAAYGGAVVVVSSVGSEVKLTTAQILAPIDTLFDAFWAALGGPPALSSAASTSTITSEDPSDSTPPAAPGQVNAAQDGSDSAPPEPAAADNAETPEVESAEVDASATVEGELEKTRLPARPTPAPSLTTALPAARARAGAAFLGALLECAVFVALVGDAKPSSSEAGVPDVPAADEGVIAGDAPVTATDADARIRASGRALLADVLRAAVAAEDASFLVHVLKTFGGRLFEMFGEGESVALDALLARRAYSFLLTQPALLFAYLTHRAAHKQSLYRALLSDIAVHPEAAGDALGALVGSGARKALEGLTAVDGGDVYASTSSVDATTRDASVAGPLDALITGDPMVVIPTPVLAQILERAELFLSPTAARKALSRVVQGFAARVEAALVRPTDEMDPELSRSASTLAGFETDLALLGGVLAARPEAVRGPDAEVLFPAVYVFAYVLPETKAGAGAVEVARNMWVQWCDEADATGEERVSVLGEVKRRLGVLVCSTDVCVTPEDVLNALAQGTLSVPVDVVTDVFPSKVELDAMLEALPSDPPAASLAVLHPLLPPAGAIRPMKPANAHDARGYAAYARIVAALLQALAADRRAAKEHVWALRHVLALALYAEDLLAVPAAPSPVFDAASSSLNLVALAKLGTDAQQFATYLLTSSIDDGWRARTLTAVMGETALVGGGALPGLLVDLIGCARKEGSRDCRLLERVLLQLLQDADKAEADLWVALARKIEKTAPETCIAVVSAVSTSRLEPPRLERYRNELAADLLGIPAGKANKQGLLALRKLAASAPPADSDVVFLPQQRSVNVFKACQQWIASDEDIEEELESVMTLVFFSLAPLLQNVPGTHWDLTFDVLENNLDTAALTDDETLVTLARTLRLITLIQDLALTNKTLRADWEGRQMEILTMVRDLAAGQLDGSAASTPRSTCRELVLSIVQDLPASLITEDTLPKMCHLLADPSVDVQKMTYQLLNVAARKRTEHFVIEAGVDVDAVVKADLPLELLDILQTSLNFNQGDLLDLDESTIFGYLLGWMVVFDLFTDASLKVRLSYVAQLRTLDIIGTSFIPNLLSLLGVDQGIPKAFKLDMWNVEEYFVQLYESGSTWSIQVLAAHLYYRALLTVPSLIYNWVLDCKDRQLSSSIATYTSLHFSPVIIRAELAHVKSPEATAELVDENLTVKVATAVNEVVASYLVDEHQLEIKLKIPSDWPLHKIEVKDVQRVGVEETRWRAWILAVQQTLWSQNGRIVDGIGLFKKNVTLHFEGQVECAICYSIISVMDGTLPRKPCKTCKNRFHSGCLYKWFSTSHSSSCPLCRSDII
ncbi:hypothetical protein C8R43DRAFT_887120 [Mycena crocata]|nr:hypothetical protein C8R43DRAFT_887120 [Mycena crocata]